MEHKVENIELRSEKARSIIGQIPPRIVRVGITLISIIIIVFLSGIYFFEYDYSIKTTASIEHRNDTTTVAVRIPANEINKVKLGHKVVLNFDKIPNLYNEKLITEIQSIPIIIDISSSGGNYLSMIILTNETQMESGVEIKLNEKLEINAVVITDKISFFDRVLEPYRSLIKRKEK
jgi:hypothetical protein